MYIKYLFATNDAVTCIRVIKPPNKMFRFASPDPPIFFEIVKNGKTIPNSLVKEARTNQLTSTRSCFINNNWYDMMSLSLIIYAKSFKGCLDI